MHNKIRYDLYACNNDDTERYLMGKSGETYIATMGLNCSTANQYKSDPTVAKSEEVCRQSGYRGFLMLNLYPARSTDFHKLPFEADPAAYRINMTHILDVFRAHPGMVCWAAWGKSILSRDYFQQAAAEVLRASQEFGIRWRHFGPLTLGGHPRHPSRLSYAWVWSDFDMAKYVEALKTSSAV